MPEEAASDEAFPPEQVAGDPLEPDAGELVEELILSNALIEEAALD